MAARSRSIKAEEEVTAFELDDLFGEDGPLTPEDGQAAKRVPESKPPEYDTKLLVTTFPKLIQMKFKMDKSSGVIVVTLINKGGERQDVEIGTELPTETEDLVLAITSATECVDQSAVEEVEDLFEGLE